MEVRNLPPNFNYAQMEPIFRQYGEVKEVNFTPEGHYYMLCIRYAEPSSTHRAVQAINGMILNGF